MCAASAASRSRARVQPISSARRVTP
jgi:hypothetical protein